MIRGKELVHLWNEHTIWEVNSRGEAACLSISDQVMAVCCYCQPDELVSRLASSTG